jgi:hypothetical protein
MDYPSVHRPTCHGNIITGEIDGATLLNPLLYLYSKITGLTGASKTAQQGYFSNANDKPTTLWTPNDVANWTGMHKVGLADSGHIVATLIGTVCLTIREEIPIVIDTATTPKSRQKMAMKPGEKAAFAAGGHSGLMKYKMIK